MQYICQLNKPNFIFYFIFCFQETRVCERVDEVDCPNSEKYYSLNLELYGNSQPTNLEGECLNY